jgi:hypothetical protein
MATIVVFFMGVMVFGSMDVLDIMAANQTTTTLIQNFVAGALELEAPSTKGFNNILIGQANNSLANLDVINMRDYRGSGAGWAVTGVMNDLTTTGIGVNTIANSVIAWAPGSQFALDGGSNTGVAVGTAGFFNVARTLINASTNNGMGNYRVNGTVLNVVYSGSPTQVAGTYQNTLTLTIN